MSQVLLLIIAVLLALLTLMIFQARHGGLVLKLDEVTRKLRDAASHYGDVNAVAELTRQLRNSDQLMQELSDYPRQVVAAALTHRVNTIGNDLKVAQQALSNMRGMLARHGHLYQENVNRLEKLVGHLMEELHEAEEVASSFHQPQSVT